MVGAVGRGVRRRCGCDCWGRCCCRRCCAGIHGSACGAGVECGAGAESGAEGGCCTRVACAVRSAHSVRGPCAAHCVRRVASGLCSRCSRPCASSAATGPSAAMRESRTAPAPASSAANSRATGSGRTSRADRSAATAAMPAVKDSVSRPVKPVRRRTAAAGDREGYICPRRLGAGRGGRRLPASGAVPALSHRAPPAQRNARNESETLGRRRPRHAGSRAAGPPSAPCSAPRPAHATHDRPAVGVQTLTRARGDRIVPSSNRLGVTDCHERTLAGRGWPGPRDERAEDRAGQGRVPGRRGE